MSYATFILFFLYLSDSFNFIYSIYLENVKRITYLLKYKYSNVNIILFLEIYNIHIEYIYVHCTYNFSEYNI